MEARMTVYVDPLRPWKGKLWSHMAADTIEELVAFAAKVGKPKLHKTPYPHFDLGRIQRERAVKLGAVEVRPKEMVLKLRSMVRGN